MFINSTQGAGAPTQSPADGGGLPEHQFDSTGAGELRGKTEGDWLSSVTAVFRHLDPHRHFCESL